MRYVYLFALVAVLSSCKKETERKECWVCTEITTVVSKGTIVSSRQIPDICGKTAIEIQAYKDAELERVYPAEPGDTVTYVSGCNLKK